MPVMSLEFDIHCTNPSITVPVPSVTMNESIPISTTKPPLMTPTTTAVMQADEDRRDDAPSVLGVQDRDQHRGE